MKGIKKKIYKVINELNALILYVLNATQLGTIDDDLLLSLVSKAMEESGKQSRNRFMFVVNKVDYFDPDNGESLERALINVKDYLRYHGIENPNIYLASSETAKVIRLHKNRYELSRKQRQTYNELGLFLNEEEFHLEKYAPLSKLGRYKIGEALANAKSDEDIALIHTGIPAIEIAINEYLDKYVLTEKINQAVNIITEEINKIKSNIYDSTVNKYWLSDVINRLNNILEI